MTDNRNGGKDGSIQSGRGGGSIGDGSVEDERTRKLDISPAQVSGAALASVTAAFLGGQLGVAGTVGGAALTSVVITVGGALYQRSLETTRDKANVAAARAALKRAKRRPLVTGAETADPSAPVRPPEPGRDHHAAPGQEPTRRLRPLPPPVPPAMHWPGGERVVDGPDITGPDQERTRRVEQEGRTRRLQWDGTRYVPAAHGRPPEGTGSGFEPGPDDSSGARPDPGRSGSGARRIRWVAVAVTSGLAFVLCMLVVTGFEGATGRTVSGADQGTTVGHLVRPGPPAGQPATPAPGEGTDTPEPLQSEPSTGVEPSHGAEPSSATGPGREPAVEPSRQEVRPSTVDQPAEPQRSQAQQPESEPSVQQAPQQAPPQQAPQQQKQPQGEMAPSTGSSNGQ